jgi:5-(carboxyamino)imidazole ribonucleotide synthase
MVNVLGQYPDISAVLNIDGAHYHSYHKAERDDRKIAHITLMPNDVTDLEPAMAKLVAILPNKVGLDKEYANVDTQPSKVDVDTKINAKNSAQNSAQNDATSDELDTKDSQTDSLTATPLKSEKAKK